AGEWRSYAIVRKRRLAPAYKPAPPVAHPEPPRAGVFVPAVSTAKIIRGDSLWQISRRTYGAGDRYTVIYDANQEQIRNPDLIYPGQIFVLPGDGKDAKAGRNG
ncbi:LysM peptidoglycan-binding domain-containing protein, partial [Methylobacterium sp. WL116]